MFKDSASRLYSRYGLNFKSGFHLRKPRLLARLAANYAKLITGGGPLLRTLDLAINWECNLNCRHCFTTTLQDPDHPERLDIEEYKRVAGEARRLGAIHVALQGGEPLLHSRLREVIEALEPWSVVVSITTNGTLLSRERIYELYRMGVDHLTLSIDSGIAEEHDAFRGVSGTFAKAMEAVHEILKSPMGLTINTMVTHSNVNEPSLGKLLDFVGHNNIKCNIVLPAPIGRWEADKENIITERDGHLVRSILKRYPTVRRDLDANYWNYGCGAAKEVLYVSPEGNVLPCPFIHALLGNARNASLKQLRARALRYKEFSDYADCCLAAEDRRFIETHLSRSWSRQGRLMDIDDMMRKKDPS